MELEGALETVVELEGALETIVELEGELETVGLLGRESILTVVVLTGSKSILIVVVVVAEGVPPCTSRPRGRMAALEKSDGCRVTESFLVIVLEGRFVDRDASTVIVEPPTHTVVVLVFFFSMRPSAVSEGWLPLETREKSCVVETTFVGLGGRRYSMTTLVNFAGGLVEIVFVTTPPPAADE